jgi:dihydrofolate synthase/folylpolyglutamate synthase
VDEKLSLSFLAGLQRTGIVPGLQRIVPLLERLGNPHLAYPSVLVGGTNGKGSTCAFIESILRNSGYRTGLFTSPHLVDVRERVRIGGSALELSKFEQYGEEVGRKIADSCLPTYFEALTAIGFLAFQREEVEIAVVEVGMGGKFDSTNCLEPMVSVLTNVSLDHQRFLGDTVEKIALEKVGIARHKKNLITAVNDAIFESTVKPACDEIGAHPLKLHRDFFASKSGECLKFRMNGTEVSAVPGLRGTFQTENAALAIACCQVLKTLGFKIGKRNMEAGLAETRWAGRFQVLKDSPTLIVDGCHNEGAATRLKETIEEEINGRPIVLVHSSKPEKDYKSVLKQIAPLCQEVIETTNDGLMDPFELAQTAKTFADCDIFCIPKLRDALDYATEEAKRIGGCVLVTGSLYLVGGVFKELGAKVCEGY